VRVVKLIDSSLPAAAPTITAQVPTEAQVSEALAFSAQAREDGAPALAWRWISETEPRPLARAPATPTRGTRISPCS